MREAIINELVEVVKEVAGEGYTVQRNFVKKNNGIEFLAVNVRLHGEELSPIVYVDEFVDDIEKEKMTVAEAAEKIFELYEEHKILGFETVQLTDKKYILDHVEYQLINAELNADSLQRAPSKKLEDLDLAALYRTVVSSDENGIASYIVSNEVMKIAGISIEELDEAADRNTEKTGFVVKTMDEVMDEIIGVPEEVTDVMNDIPKMFVLTNTRKVNGANILLYGTELAALAEKIGEDFFILPSSIHEVLAVPVSQAEPEALKQMVNEVNDTKVASNEILGYKVYRYDSETGVVRIAA